MEKHTLSYMPIKTKLVLTVLAMAFFLIPAGASATTTVFETTGWIIDTQGTNYEFTADQSPNTYRATLTDLSEAPDFGFEPESLYLSITTSTKTLGSTTGPGIFTFLVELGKKYFVNIFGTGSGNNDAGLYGVDVVATPIPGAIWLLSSGLVGLGYLKRRIFSA